MQTTNLSIFVNHVTSICHRPKIKRNYSRMVILCFYIERYNLDGHVSGEVINWSMGPMDILSRVSVDRKWLSDISEWIRHDMWMVRRSVISLTWGQKWGRISRLKGQVRGCYTWIILFMYDKNDPVSVAILYISIKSRCLFVCLFLCLFVCLNRFTTPTKRKKILNCGLFAKCSLNIQECTVVLARNDVIATWLAEILREKVKKCDKSKNCRP